MANYGLHEFTAQESVNFEAFKTWNYEEIGLPDTDPYTATYITSTDPAKKIVIYNDADIAGASISSGDVITIQLNGESGTGKPIKIDSGDLPFTISGLSVTELILTNAGGGSSESLTVLSFH